MLRIRQWTALVQLAGSSHSDYRKHLSELPAVSCTRFKELLVRLGRGKSRSRLLQMWRDFPRGVLAAWLAFSAVSAQACQLALLGPVTQRPLTNNPFQAGASTAEVTFTLRNADSKPCDAAFAFFGLGTPQAQADGATSWLSAVRATQPSKPKT
jgi:hypothetical protein